MGHRAMGHDFEASYSKMRIAAWCCFHAIKMIMDEYGKQRVAGFVGRWFCMAFLGAAYLCSVWGCAAVPNKATLKDMSQSFDEGTIISAKTGGAVSFETLMADVSTARIVYIGERHTNPMHHQVQLRVIKALFGRDASMAVGMEMFDRTYGSVLEQWSAGELDEKAFLEKTHWYANWRFNYGLYREVLDFIKSRNIRLVGLNMPFHIPPKIATGGIASLSEDERKHLPPAIDTSDAAHRAHVAEVFKHHPHMMGRDNFDYFYMAQCAWEDTMAESIALNLKEDRMVVLAGNGHIIRERGIPKRAFARTGAAFKTIYLVPVGDSAELSYADYIWVTSSTGGVHRKPVQKK